MSSPTKKGTPLLIEELEKLPRTPDVLRLLGDACAGLYHDFRSPLGAPKTQLVLDLMACRPPLKELAARVRRGHFDDVPPGRNRVAT